MSTTKAKKPTPKTVSPVAKFKPTQKVYYILSVGLGEEEILEAEVSAVRSFTCQVKTEVGKPAITNVGYRYDLITRRGTFEVAEYELHGNFTDAAKAYATNHVTLLK